MPISSFKPVFWSTICGFLSTLDLLSTLQPFFNVSFIRLHPTFIHVLQCPVLNIFYPPFVEFSFLSFFCRIFPTSDFLSFWFDSLFALLVCILWFYSFFCAPSLLFYPLFVIFLFFAYNPRFIILLSSFGLFFCLLSVLFVMQLSFFGAYCSIFFLVFVFF